MLSRLRPGLGRIHSRDLRTLQDLPAFDRAIVLKVRVRRFFCDNPMCPRRTFVEPLGELAPAHARKTGP